METLNALFAIGNLLFTRFSLRGAARLEEAQIDSEETSCGGAGEDGLGGEGGEDGQQLHGRGRDRERVGWPEWCPVRVR